MRKCFSYFFFIENIRKIKNNAMRLQLKIIGRIREYFLFKYFHCNFYFLYNNIFVKYLVRVYTTVNFAYLNQKVKKKKIEKSRDYLRIY